MSKSITIHTPPIVRINSALAAALVGLTVGLRPELLQWTTEPTDPIQGDFYYLDNDDLRSALTIRDGITVASALFGHLPLGRVTPVECRCCTPISEVVSPVERVTA